MSSRAAVANPRGPYASPRQAERQRRILEAARREVTAKGYDALTMASLASAADVSTKTLYNLFGSKDLLLLAAVADLMGNLERLPEVTEAEPGLLTLEAFARVVFRQVQQTPRYAEVMARALFQADAEHRLVDILLGNAREFTARELESAVAAGQLKAEVDADRLSRILTGHQWGIILMWSKGMIDLDDIEERALESQALALASLRT